MPHISTLIADVNYLLSTKGWFTDKLAASFAREVSLRMQEKFNAEERKPTLRLSQMGPKCPCALWHSIHHPELAEPLPPQAELKYAYGHLIEALAITLAKAAGHTVTGEQDEIRLDGIVGHRDCVIDGCTVDVKSCSSYMLERFKNGSIEHSDNFGYLDQLDGYVVGSFQDPLVTVHDRAYDWAIDKTLGHMALYEHHVREQSIRDRISLYKDIVSRDKAPRCECETIPDGKSGNIKLDVKASYNSFKYCCKPYLRTFLYSDGPRYLTKVSVLPKVPEVNKEGQIVYSSV